MGVVETQRGCDSVGTASIDVGSPTAIAASLGLDSSHKGFTLIGMFFYQAVIAPSTNTCASSTNRLR